MKDTNPENSQEKGCKCLNDFNCLCSKEHGCNHCRPTPQPESEGVEGWKKNLNQRFNIKRSINDKWIFCLNNTDEEEDKYNFLDNWIEQLLEAQANQIRQEKKEWIKKEIEWCEIVTKAVEVERKRCGEISKKYPCKSTNGSHCCDNFMDEFLKSTKDE